MREAEFIDITLDRPRKMALPLGALRRAEREFNRQRALDGKPETSIFRIAGDQMTLLAVDGSISIDLVVVMLWASLAARGQGSDHRAGRSLDALWHVLHDEGL